MFIVGFVSSLYVDRFGYVVGLVWIWYIYWGFIKLKIFLTWGKIRRVFEVILIRLSVVFNYIIIVIVINSIIVRTYIDYLIIYIGIKLSLCS